MTNKPRLLLDQSTGELLEQKTVEVNADVVTLPRRGRMPHPQGAFVMLWPGAILQMPRLSSAQMAIFHNLAGWMDSQTGVVSFYLDELCENTGIANNSTASTYVSRLVELGYARRLRNRRVLLNPNLAWRGNKGDRNIALFRWEHPGKDDEFTIEESRESA